MSLRPELSVGIPEETMRVAKAAFPRGCALMGLRDALGPILHDQQFAAQFPALGQPAVAPWRLALITLLQIAEGLSDRKAADAVRSRIDWKYLLGLSLSDAGFDHSVLCEFQARLIAGQAEAILFNTVLDIATSHYLVRPGGRQRTDLTHVVAAVRGLNRIAGITEPMRHALEALAVTAPDWLRLQAGPHWVQRYQRPTLATRLPSKEAARQKYACEIGEDGHHLLAAILSADAPAWLRAISAVETLRLMWVPSRNRSDNLIRSTHLRPAPRSLHRSSESPPPASGNSRSDEPYAFGTLDCKRFCRLYKDIALHAAHGSSNSSMTSPTVSKAHQNRDKAAATKFFARALEANVLPRKIVIERSARIRPALSRSTEC